MTSLEKSIKVIGKSRPDLWGVQCLLKGTEVFTDTMYCSGCRRVHLPQEVSPKYLGPNFFEPDKDQDRADGEAWGILIPILREMGYQYLSLETNPNLQPGPPWFFYFARGPRDPERYSMVGNTVSEVLANAVLFNQRLRHYQEVTVHECMAGLEFLALDRGKRT